MKRSLTLIAAMLLIQWCNAQLAAESVVGVHSGMHSWDRSLLTIELKENSVYEIKSYSRQLEIEKTVKGRWRIEGDHVVLTDVLGAETVLYKYNDQCYMVAENGVSCIARFSLNKDLKSYWAEVKKAGC